MRMLIGFSIENLIKALLLQNPTKLATVFSKEGNLSWEKDGHALLKLANEADFHFSTLEAKYVEVWQVSALWAGRYPIPMKERDLPAQRAGARDRIELAKQAIKRRNKAQEEGDPFMGSEVHDILHVGVSHREIEAFRGISERLNALLNNVIAAPRA